jgi:hypothetical protein
MVNSICEIKRGGWKMSELLQEYATPVQDDGITYVVRSYGQERVDGTWTGWLEFYPDDVNLPVLRTGQETSQPNRLTVEYWATGLEPVYLEGAFTRAKSKAVNSASQASRY